MPGEINPKNLQFCKWAETSLFCNFINIVVMNLLILLSYLKIRVRDKPDFGVKLSVKNEIQ